MTDTAVQTIPQAGTWDADPVHSSLDFTIRHMMATKVRGRFTDWTATLTTGSSAGDATLEAVIQAASVTTFNEQRDGHLRSADFFESDKYPTLEFRSTSVSELGTDNRFTVTGDLTAHGVTNPVTLDVEFAGIFVDQRGSTKATFSATTEIERERWGLTWNQPLGNGGFMLGKAIKVEVEVQFALRAEQQ